jgi:hypothetical protein
MQKSAARSRRAALKAETPAFGRLVECYEIDKLHQATSNTRCRSQGTPDSGLSGATHHDKLVGREPLFNRSSQTARLVVHLKSVIHQMHMTFYQEVKLNASAANRSVLVLQGSAVAIRT